MEYISILPDNIALDAEHRYMRLPHPRTGLAQLYLPTQQDGQEAILEVVRLQGSKRRTWFIGDNTIDSGTMLIHHPVDPLFLVIPLVMSLLSTSSSSTPFQPLSALISTISSSPAFALSEPFTKPGPKDSAGTYNDDVSRLLGTRSVKRVFKLCCERKFIPAGPPTPPAESISAAVKSRGTSYYRPSMEMILKLLKIKIDYFASEDQWNCFDHLVRSLGRDGLLGKDTNQELVRTARIKATVEHYSQYLPPSVTKTLNDSYDFAALNTHLANMTAATLAASMPPSNSNKDKAAAAAAKRKATTGSRGVEALKKVNTSSMAKMTSFFKPKGK